MMTRDGTQTYLAQYFSDMADWHDSAIHEDDDGPAGGRDSCANFYRALAAHIQGLAEDDLRLAALSRLTGFDDQHDFSPGPHVSVAIADIARFLDQSPGVFLDQLVYAALNDQSELRQASPAAFGEDLALAGVAPLGMVINRQDSSGR